MATPEPKLTKKPATISFSPKKPTTKPVVKKPAPTTNTPEADSQAINSALQLLAQQGFGGIQAINDNGNRNTSSTSIDTETTNLNYNSAKALLEDAMQTAEFVGKLNKQDILDFMALFKQEQNKNIGKVITTTANKVVAGATPDAVKKVVDSTNKQNFASMFDPKQFASDFIWKKINFSDEKTLGGKSLAALSSVRGLVKSFNLLGVTDNDIKVAAKLVAQGKKTLDSLKVDIQQIAKREYPQFADRFNADPTLTTYDIASPVIKMLAKTWEMDEGDIPMENELVMSYMNYAGADGKGKQPSRYELLMKAKAHARYQKTQEANENARSAATGLARALGFGV